MSVALNLITKALEGLHQEISGHNIDIIHAITFPLLQRLTEFLEGVRLEGGHVNSVTVGESSYDSDNGVVFTRRGGEE